MPSRRAVAVAESRLRHRVGDVVKAGGAARTAAAALIDDAGVREDEAVRVLGHELADERVLGGVPSGLRGLGDVVVVVVVGHVAEPVAHETVQVHAVAQLQRHPHPKVSVGGMRVLSIAHNALVEGRVNGEKLLPRIALPPLRRLLQHGLRGDVLQGHLLLQLPPPKVFSVHQPEVRARAYVLLHLHGVGGVEAKGGVVHVNPPAQLALQQDARARHHRAAAEASPLQRVRIREALHHGVGGRAQHVDVVLDLGALLVSRPRHDQRRVGLAGGGALGGGAARCAAVRPQRRRHQQSLHFSNELGVCAQEARHGLRDGGLQGVRESLHPARATLLIGQLSVRRHQAQHALTPELGAPLVLQVFQPLMLHVGRHPLRLHV
mmetsp:Transcript_32858/g.61823  ORF Transcript_32858/g.61823 Transcript_32858/m.61823 type:complete len:378 (-) Transcript_32858:317-1450(-)